MEKEQKQRHSKKKYRTYNINKSFGVQLNLGAVLQKKMEVYKMRQNPKKTLISFESHSSKSFSSLSDNNEYYDKFLKNIIKEKKKSRSQQIEDQKKLLVDYNQLNRRKTRKKSEACYDVKRRTRKKNTAMKIYLAPINEEKKANNNIVDQSKIPEIKTEHFFTVNNETSFSINEKKRNMNNINPVVKDGDVNENKPHNDIQINGDTNTKPHAQASVQANVYSNANMNTNPNTNADTIFNTPAIDNCNNTLTQDHEIHIEQPSTNNNVTTLPIITHFNLNKNYMSNNHIFHSNQKKERHQSCFINSPSHQNSPEDEDLIRKPKMISVFPFRIPKSKIEKTKNKVNELCKDTSVFQFINNQTNNKHHSRNNSNHKKKNENSDLASQERLFSEFMLKESSHNIITNYNKDRKRDKNKEIIQLTNSKTKQGNNHKDKDKDKTKNTDEKNKENEIVRQIRDDDATKNNNNTNHVPIKTLTKENIDRLKKKSNWFLCCIPVYKA